MIWTYGVGNWDSSFLICSLQNSHELYKSPCCLQTNCSVTQVPLSLAYSNSGNIEEIKSYLETDTPTIYLGRCEYVQLPTSVDSERILFDLDEEYCSETGCENYIYEGVTDEQNKWLEDKLSDLMLEFHKMIGLKPCWFTVVEQEEIDLCEYEKENKWVWTKKICM